MRLLKRNPVFFTLIVVFILVFLAGAYLAFANYQKVGETKKEVGNAENQLRATLNADPAPSVDNVEASQANVRALQTELESIRENLQRGSRLTTSQDGVRVSASIQQYITEYQNRVATYTYDGTELDEDGNPKPRKINTPANFAFGFEQYLTINTIPDDPEIIPVLDKQRQILSYILNQLITSNPDGIQRVQRELVERQAPAEGTTARRSNNQESAGFQINRAVSARVPGAIDTLAFSVTFTGYTDSLRQFLNQLASFEMPLVVRSVEVARPAGTTQEKRPTGNALDQIFGNFGGAAEEAEPTVRTEAQKPVIEENLSSFTVTLEFIEIVLPSETKSGAVAESEENPS